MTIPAVVLSGKWCPYCAKNVKLTIKEMKEIAKKRDGECLSNIYVNSQSKLIWKCEKGHVWKAIPSSIKTGRWCPICTRKK